MSTSMQNETRAAGREAAVLDWSDPRSWYEQTISEWHIPLVELGILLLAVIVGLIIHWMLFAVVARIVQRTKWAIDDELITQVRKPSRLIFPLLAVQVVLPSLVMAEEIENATGFTPAQLIFIRHVVSIAAIAAIAWMVMSLLDVLESVFMRRHRTDVADNLEARRVRTQVSVLKKTAYVFIIVVGAAAVLMTFPRVRELGASMLASAGIAGLVIGLAARPVLENIFAGLQIALAQPIRIDDVVIIEGEFGRVEEITTTYVVLRLWDERRLIVPFSKFISEPFQNWTRTQAQLLGMVSLHVDYRTPFAAVRAELDRIVKDHPKWDGRVCNLQVTDATEQTVQIRALMSAANSGDAWDLRVDVREKLIEFLRRKHPEALPKTRVELPVGGTPRRPEE